MLTKSLLLSELFGQQSKDKSEQIIYLPKQQKNPAISESYYTTKHSHKSLKGLERRTSRKSQKSSERWVIDKKDKHEPRNYFTSHRLSNLYTIPNKIDVDSFLAKHPKLIDFALKAAAQVKKYFSNEILSLEVVSDPEIPDYEEISVYIETSLNAEDAFQRLSEFDEQWLLESLDETNSLFSFNLRFV